MTRRVTIKSIAKDLGISHMTVSRALTNHPNVRKSTREAVQKRARELGYVKSAAAVAMRGDGTKIIGLLLPNIASAFYGRFAQKMALACAANSFQLIIHLTKDDITIEEQALARLREIQAQAVVLVPAPESQKIETTDQNSMPIIQVVGRREIKGAEYTLKVEDTTAICDAVLHLAKSGHTRIAYIGGDFEHFSERRRLTAFQNGMALAGLQDLPNLIRIGPPSFTMGRDHARDILDNTKATALVCGEFEISNGALSSYMGAGETRQSKTAFVGYGDPAFYAWINGGISTIQLPVKRLAKKAVDLIAHFQPNESPQNVAFEAKFIVRGLL